MLKVFLGSLIAINLLGTVVLGGCQTSQPSEVIKTSNTTTVMIDTDVVVTGLEVPWAIEFAPDGRIFVTERPGRVRIIMNGQLLDEPWAAMQAIARL